MATQLARNNEWWLALRSMIAVLLGLVALWSSGELPVLGLLFGAYALADGLLALIVTWSNHQTGEHEWVLLKGLPGITIGGLICLWPNATLLVLMPLIAVWTLLTVTVEVLIMFDMRHKVTDEQRMAWNSLIKREQRTR